MKKFSLEEIDDSLEVWINMHKYKKSASIAGAEYARPELLELFKKRLKFY